MSMKPKTSKKPAEIIRKEFLRGSATDENTMKNSLIFFGSLLIVFFMSFVVSATTSGNDIIRLIVSIAIITLTMVVFFNKGSVHGAEAVARGEILWQKQEKGQTFSESERKICFHPLKAFLIGLIGTIPLFLVAVVFSLNTSIQTTTAGALPSWMQAYLRRDDVSGPLVSYIQSAGMGLVDILRIIVRLTVMPFISLVGTSDHYGVYLIEKLSPLILLLPACAYGTGYLTGPSVREKVHTAISENNRRRERREKKERRIRAGIAAKPKEPEKLN